MAWVGDETPWELGVTVVSTKTADTRGDYVLALHACAYRRGARYYHDAVTGPDEREHLNANAPEVIAIIAKAIGQSEDQVKLALTYADPDERIGVKDIVHQVDWHGAGHDQGRFQSRSRLIDRRYVMLFPEK